VDFGLTDRCRDYQSRLWSFMTEVIEPAEPAFYDQLRRSGNPNHYPDILDELKDEARRRGLWNLFHPDPDWGPGLTNCEYAPLCEILGHSGVAQEATNCSAPDTGNMEVLTLFGTKEQQDRWLQPLLDGKIRSVFAMTEPQVASSDANNIELRIDKDGADYVLNGRKWWASNGLHPHAQIIIVMGKTDPGGPRHRQHSQILVPIDTPGVRIVRGLPVFGFQDREGHAEIEFTDVRVPRANLLGNEGDGFLIGQARLGPGRIHHCMRMIGAAERALGLLCKRATERTTFGQLVAERSNIQDWIAESRVEIDMIRLLTMKTAWLMDTVGNKEARVEIAAIKVAAPQVALKVIDRAIQVHGGAGVTDDFPLAEMYAHNRILRIADGPDEVHKRMIAHEELSRHRGGESHQAQLATVGW
jgi:acyl-CoA dehydrogenase